MGAMLRSTLVAELLPAPLPKEGEKPSVKGASPMGAALQSEVALAVSKAVAMTGMAELAVAPKVVAVQADAVAQLMAHMRPTTEQWPAPAGEVADAARVQLALQGYVAGAALAGGPEYALVMELGTGRLLKGLAAGLPGTPEGAALQLAVQLKAASTDAPMPGPEDPLVLPMPPVAASAMNAMQAALLPSLGVAAG